jgi:hypothetical protein
MKLVSSFEQNKVNPQAGVQLDGLWLQGCDFDGARLNEIRDSSGSSSELIQLPVCSIAWIRKEDPEPYQSGTVVSQILLFYQYLIRMCQSIIQSIEKSSFAPSMFLTTVKTGEESLVASHCSSMDLRLDNHHSLC